MDKNHDTFIKALSFILILFGSTFSINAQNQDIPEVDAIFSALNGITLNEKPKAVDVQNFSSLIDEDDKLLGSLGIRASNNFPNFEFLEYVYLGKVYMGANVKTNFWGDINNMSVKKGGIEQFAKKNNNFTQMEALIGGKSNALRFGLSLVSNKQEKDQVNEGSGKLEYSTSGIIARGAGVGWGGTFKTQTLTWKPILNFDYSMATTANANPKNQKETFLNSTDNISFTVGSEFLIPTKNNLTNLVGLNYSMAFTKTGPDEKVKTKDAVYTKSVIPLFDPYYALIYDNDDDLYIKGSIHLNLGGASLESEQELTGIIGLKGSGFVMNPGFNFDILYNIIRDKLKLNISSDIYLPVLFVLDAQTLSPKLSAEAIYTSPINANLKSGIEWNLTQNFIMTIDLNATIAPKLSPSVIDGITLGFNYTKHTK